MVSGSAAGTGLFGLVRPDRGGRAIHFPATGSRGDRRCSVGRRARTNGARTNGGVRRSRSIIAPKWRPIGPYLPPPPGHQHRRYRRHLHDDRLDCHRRSARALCVYLGAGIGQRSRWALRGGRRSGARQPKTDAWVLGIGHRGVLHLRCVGRTGSQVSRDQSEELRAPGRPGRHGSVARRAASRQPCEAVRGHGG